MYERLSISTTKLICIMYNTCSNVDLCVLVCDKGYQASPFSLYIRNLLHVFLRNH